jgi:hypothetical protein
MTELALVEVIPMGLLDVFFSRIPDKCQRNEEKDERSADSSCICYKLLGILFEEHYDKNWYRYNDTPHSFYDPAIILI